MSEWQDTRARKRARMINYISGFILPVSVARTLIRRVNLDSSSVMQKLERASKAVHDLIIALYMEHDKMSEKEASDWYMRNRKKGKKR